MVKLKKHDISAIKYTKSDGSSSTRDIIPLSVPGNVSAFDVSDMDQDSRELLMSRLSEYSDFRAEAMKSVLTFDVWMAATHTKQPIDGIKWRSFKPDRISDP